MNKHAKRWSTMDEAFLMEHYPVLGARTCAKRLGRTPEAVALRHHQIAHNKPKTVSQAMRSWWSRMFGGSR